MRGWYQIRQTVSELPPRTNTTLVKLLVRRVINSAGGRPAPGANDLIKGRGGRVDVTNAGENNRARFLLPLHGPASAVAGLNGGECARGAREPALVCGIPCRCSNLSPDSEITASSPLLSSELLSPLPHSTPPQKRTETTRSPLLLFDFFLFFQATEVKLSTSMANLTIFPLSTVRQEN